MPGDRSDPLGGRIQFLNAGTKCFSKYYPITGIFVLAAMTPEVGGQPFRDDCE